MADNRFYNSKKITITELAKLCNCVLNTEIKNDIKITGCASLKSASNTEISFLQVGKFIKKTLPKLKEDLENTKAIAVFINEEDLQYLPKNVMALISNNPKQAFMTALDYFYNEIPNYSISPSAKISQSVKFEDKSSVFIGENVVIEDNVEIGRNFVCQANSVIKQGCVIGQNVVIDSCVVISHAIIGNNCVFSRLCQIGSAGFGYEATQQGFKYIHQIGRVIIGNNVEIGACSCVDRGALDDTIIGDGTKLDDLVMIGHGSVIGKSCLICGQAGMAGNTTVGDFVICAGQSGLAGHLTVGSNSQIGGQSGVMADLAPNSKVIGSPSMDIKDFFKLTAFTRQMLKQGKKQKDD